MARKEYEMLFSLNAQMNGNFSGTFSKAQQQLVNMQKELQNLSKKQGDISAYQKQQQAVESTQKKLETLQQQYENIQKEIQETGTYSSDLENKLLSKQQQIDKTAASLDRQTQKLGQMGNALRDAGVDTSNLGKESERLSAEMADLKKKEEDAAEGAQNFGSASASAFETAANALAAAGLIAGLKKIADAYMQCIGIAGNFEASMSNVEALSGASAEELAQLSAMAKELGATTKFTAKESADAMGYMAMAGWDAQQILSGMPGVLSLAAAAGEDLATVSDIVTDSMTAFGLSASETGRYADVLAATAANANTSVAVMGETFKYAAPVAGALGYSIEDVSTAIGLMANAGIKGSNAGTALRNVFNGLLGGVTLTSEAFGEVQVSAVQADGTMADFATTINELRGYFEQMSEAERVTNAQAIAGQRGYAGLLQILNASEADYAKLTKSINESAGAAQRMADIRLDNMTGRLTLLNSAWEAVQTTVGEQFTPVLADLYEEGAKVLSEVNGFLQRNPSLIKGITVLVGGLGSIATGIVGISAAIKIVKALNIGSMLAGPVGMIAAAAAGVTVLSSVLVALYNDAEAFVPKVRELTEAARNMQDVMSSAGQAFSDTTDSTMAAASVADHYISKLEEMGDYESLSAEQKKEYRNYLSLLCETVPELSDLIDAQNGIIDGGTQALRQNTEEWKRNAIVKASQEELNKLYAAYAAVEIEAATNDVKRTRATDELTEAQNKLSRAQERMVELSAQAVKEAEAQTRATGDYVDPVNLLTAEYHELEAAMPELAENVRLAEKSLNNINAAIDADTDAVAAAKEAIDIAEDAIGGLTSATDSAAAAAEDMSRGSVEVAEAINSVTEKVKLLTEEYNKAYEAAYSSISGQYDLWDEAGAVAEKKTADISAALETQTKHWNDYNANLSALRDRAGDIEGLSDVITSFADGSDESVAAIAGMANASKEDLEKMVKQWKDLQEAQKATSGTIAEFKTDFTQQMDELTQELQNDIKALDMSGDAAESGRATIQAFIDSAASMENEVRNAYAKLGIVASAALGSASGSYAPLETHGWMEAYAKGTDYAKAGFALVGEKGPEIIMLRGGEKILNAEETKQLQREYVTLAPYLLDYMEAYAAGTEYARAGLALVGEKGAEAMIMPPRSAIAYPTPMEAMEAIPSFDEKPNRGIQITVPVTINIEGNATQETVDYMQEALSAFKDEITDHIIDALEENKKDQARRAYI